LIPGDLVGPLKRQRIALHIGRGPKVPRLLAALRAMARIGRMKFAIHRKPHRAAKAGTVVFHRQHSIVTPKILRKKLFFHHISCAKNTNAQLHHPTLCKFNRLTPRSVTLA
jgi:hypothetical protein